MNGSNPHYRKGISIELVSKESIEVARNFGCLLCNKLAYSPLLCLFCETKFCKACINTYNIKKKTCPCCQREFFQQSLELKEQLKLHEVLIRCIFYDKGCKSVIKYTDYYNHVDNCR